MSLVTLNCCGLKELGDISTYFDGFEEIPFSAEQQAMYVFRRNKTWQKKIFNEKSSLECIYQFCLDIRQTYCLPIYDNKPYLPNLKCGAVVFTEARSHAEAEYVSPGDPIGYAQPLIDTIKKMNFGEVHTLPTFINTNTARLIMPYLWVVNHERVVEWYLEEWQKRESEKPKEVEKPATVSQIGIELPTQGRLREAARRLRG